MISQTMELNKIAMEKQQLHFIWPEVFTNENFNYDVNDHLHKKLALANGLVGWAICMSGGAPPKLFGVAMVKIGSLLDEMATHDNLLKVAIEYKNRTRTL